MTVRLLKPDAAALPSYRAALAQGWSPDNLRAAVAQEELAASAADPAGFLDRFDDPEAKGGPVTLPDGSQVPRLPGFRRWIWEDGEADGFCGSIGFRWQPGSAELPPYVSGHIGYAVVPWLRNRGHATAALRLLLADIAPLGLPYVELTAREDNVASRRVIERCGGVVAGLSTAASHAEGAPSLLYRIALGERSGALA